MKNKLILFASFLGQLVFAQTQQPAIYDQYPDGQDDYIGGNVQFFKELHDVFIEQKLKPCENKDEGYIVNYVVYSDASIKFLKPENPEYAEKKKCTYDLIKASFKYLHNWKPAEVNGVKVAAISGMSIYPDDLFDNYKAGYDINKLMTQPSFAEGINVFRKRFANNVDMSQFSVSNEGQIIISFVVNEDGGVEDIKLLQGGGNQQFDNMIINAVKRVKGRWNPGMVRGKAVKSRFRFPVRLKN